jgi:hypothetical protein
MEILVICSFGSVIVSGYHRKVKIHRRQALIYGLPGNPETGNITATRHSRYCEQRIIAAIV